VTPGRLPSGGSWIDRSRPVSFRFDGAAYEGFAGDTLASALLANGVRAGFRSPILGRPRGVMTAGPEEPNAYVAVLEPWIDLIAPATIVPLVAGVVAESRAGVGDLRDADQTAARGRHTHRYVEVVVIGGTLEGLAAAREAAERGGRVLVVDEQPRDGARSSDGARSRSSGDVTVLRDATALGLYDDGYVVIHERTRPVETIWHVRAERVVLATGATERPIAFAGNDLPGVMLAGAAATYATRFGVRPGERAVVFTTNDVGHGCVRALRDAGCEIVAVVDPRLEGDRPEPPEPRVEVVRGGVVESAEGRDALERVVVRDQSGDAFSLPADLLAVSGGFNASLGLWRSIGGRLRFDDARATFLPDLDADGAPPWLGVVGSAAGDGLPESSAFWFVPADDYSEHFVDLQRDQTVHDVALALDAGLTSVEHVKRATYIGTAVDQGRTSGVVTAEIVNQLLGAGPGAQGPSNARPPSLPVSYAALAGPYRGDLLDPVRTTPMHERHMETGAVFENVGQWKRPWFFPRDGGSMEEAVSRECLAVRNGVGVLDASTLGKIEVVGPDAPAFLDRMYTNRMSNLPIGSIRYGLMLGLDGMVVDDGVAMRTADDRYLVTTTTGGAAMVLDRFEEWLQTEWTDLRVYCTSVTEQWADVAIAGPRAREVLEAVGTDVDLSNDSFPFMTFRDGTVAGVPARVARVSFTGELSFEVMVPWWNGAHVWDAVLRAGEPFGIAPYGTETMHVLRAEKGFVIVGQDTDGTVTPFDLGMDRIVNMSKGDFVGRRSLSRPDASRSGRKQLVGLVPDDPEALLPEGAQLVLEDARRIPAPMAGFVTSSYRSPSLGRTFALAMLSDGHSMHGRTVFAPLPERTIAATVTEPVFYDPEGARRDG
jgi:sarcosine oxidase subunit alpha